MNLVEIEKEIMRFSHLLDAGLTALRESAKTYADADVAYRRAYSEAFLRAEGAATVREQIAQSAALESRNAMQLSDGMRTAALEAVRSRRTQISALQSLLAAHKAEAEFARTGPN